MDINKRSALLSWRRENIWSRNEREEKNEETFFGEGKTKKKHWWWMGNRMGIGIVVTTGNKPSSNIGSALVSAMYDRSSELGLYRYRFVSNLHLRLSV